MSWLQTINPFQSKLSTGIQITDTLIRFVSFRVQRKKITIHAFGETFLSEGIVKNGRIVDHARLVQALETLRMMHNFKKTTVVLPDEQSFIFHTTIPDVQEGEIQTVIEDHVQSYLELHQKTPQEKTVCSCEIIGVHEGVYEVQVVVTPQSVVSAYKTVFEEAGFVPEVMEVGAHMVSRACLTHEQGSSCLLVDFGSEKTHVSIVSEGDVMETGTLMVGEEQLIPVIEKFLNIHRHEAKNIKKQHGLLRTHREPGLLSELMYTLSPVRDFIDRLYIRWHGRTYKTKKQQPPIEKIVLHGEGAHLKGFAEHLAIATRIPVQYANVWVSQPEYLENIPDISYQDSHRYAAAISAALRGM